MAPRLLPQSGQKARLENSEDRQVLGVPPGPVQAPLGLRLLRPPDVATAVALLRDLAAASRPGGAAAGDR